MHEFAISENILSTVKSKLDDPYTSAVSKIYITLGVLSGVEKNALQYSFSLREKKPPFIHTKLIIQENQLTILCDACKKTTLIRSSFTLKCGSCGKLTTTIIKGKEMTIDKIEC